MFATAEKALESAVREETISRNLTDLAAGYERDGKHERAEKLAELSKRRYACMLDDFGDALRLESKGV